ncbi:hypothetical protein SAMN05216188_102363 [Lentzea xinjiangensis]|uniref:TROVE domain-containing protein n=1 Tax=Lentzea xinjiangensis TaxID=402600 RepID=A0A1H9E3T1_9PSEU|nr:hypothetical protein [Lentzea xinjiangensis]SEQ19588.1 hypothetical protein SAMN05216188_102363 [Lentzea xinjiangensis]
MGGRLRRDLFRMVVSDLVGNHPNLHPERLDHYAGLVRRSTVEDPGWTAALLRWTRHGAGLAYTAHAGAAEFLAARLAAGLHGMSRQVVDSVLAEPNDPTWLLNYWSYKHGRALPKPLKRGIGDAVRRLYTEESVREHDHTFISLRFGDVLNRVHPKPVDERQSALFRSIVDRRYDRNAEECRPPPPPPPPRLPRVPGRTLLLADLTAVERYGFEDTAETVLTRCERADVVRFRRHGLPTDRERALLKVVRRSFRRHDRVVVITESQQLDRSLSRSVRRNVPLHVWDLNERDAEWATVSRHRYRHHATGAGALRALVLFEAGEQGLWPW